MYLFSPMFTTARHGAPTATRWAFAGFRLALLLYTVSFGAESATKKPLFQGTTAQVRDTTPRVQTTTPAKTVKQDSSKVKAHDTLRAAIADTTGSSAEDSLDNDESDSTETADDDSSAVSKPSARTDTAKSSPKDTLNVRSATVIGAGIGLSLGNNPVFSMWKASLPQTLTDFGYPANSTTTTPDPLALTFTVKEKADIYNMLFPLTLSFNRLYPTYRYGVAGSFSWISKTQKSTIIEGSDSLHRHIDIQQGLSLYAFTFDVLYGHAIPERYFSIDGVDRTDLVLGLSASPYLAIKSSTAIASSASDSILSAARDSIDTRQHPFSASGIGFGWRIGIITVRHVSRTGGIEAGISYFGMWSTRFRSSNGPLFNNEINPNTSGAPQEVSYYASRVEITISLVRKL
jgi:hypothetical protein